ncbi:MAG: hypothetical protein J6U64_05840 [Alphaproteobacteria bacterium]|nr:hypothetical protein [Alphaproteobacteria bacterium]
MDKVINLQTLTKYKDPESVIEALSDEDFKTKFSRIIVQALRTEDAEIRRKQLHIIQKNMSKTELKKIELALDYQGYMYDYIGKKPHYIGQNPDLFKEKATITYNKKEDKEHRKDKGYVIYFPKEDKKPKKEKIINPQRKREIEITR